MSFTKIPIDFCKDVQIESDVLKGFYNIPMATFETTLFKSIKRGAIISRKCGGIKVFCLENEMTRSILLETKCLEDSLKISNQIKKESEKFKEITKTTSNFCQFLDNHIEIVGNLLFLRFSFYVGEASGHNMTTKAADEIGSYLSKKFDCIFRSVSSNFCVDKKNSSVNGILGRGRRCYAEVTISKEMCSKILKTTPEKITKLNYDKNFVGSIIAGSVRSANAHFANILASFYLATGQDVANIVEGSQGFSYANVKEDGSLQFSISIPNVIIGSIGNGKDYEFISENIKNINIENNEGLSKKLCIILTAAVLCGEISLLASLTNEKELIQSHIKYERRN